MCAKDIKNNSADFFIEHLDVIDSTNTYARSNAARLWEKAGSSSVVVVYADVQTAGRGQRGNVWHSCAGENLLASIMVRPQALPAALQFALSQAVALAVCRAVALWGVEARLKWPNDIYVGDKKLAGILVELDCCGAVVEQAVMGVGLNVNQTSFVAMDKRPVSMKTLLGRALPVKDVLATLLDGFHRYYALLQGGGYVALASEYKNNLLGYRKVMRYRDVGTSSLFDAEIMDVGGDGRILLKRTDGTLSTYAFKEVELVLQ